MVFAAFEAEVVIWAEALECYCSTGLGTFPFAVQQRNYGYLP
jgi:hypothetical protein